MKINKRCIVLSINVLILFFLMPLSGQDKKNAPGHIQKLSIPVSPADSSMGRVDVDIYIPRGEVKGDLLVLPGWRFERSRWYKKTGLLSFAESHGYRVVFPEMNISLYASRYHKETRNRIKWQKIAGGRWIKEVMIPWLEKNNQIFVKGSKNFLLGLSTGGRGVALVALQNQGLFTAGAALSGDYNQAAMQHDRLMTRMYGTFTSFKKRWYTVDNPYHEVVKGRWKMPLYLGHGTRDRITPLSETRNFRTVLRKYAPKVPVRYNEARGYGHNFKYWGSELPAIFLFFKEQAGR